MGIITNLKLHELENIVGAIPVNQISKAIKGFCIKYFPGKQKEATEVIRTLLITLVRELGEGKW